MTITIHECQPTENQPDMVCFIVRDLHETIRRLEAKGISELWTWVQNGQNVIAHKFAKNELKRNGVI